MTRRPASSSPDTPSDRPVLRVRQRHVEWVAERMSGRDTAIVATVNRLRLATGHQLERLHFTDLHGRSRTVVRSRVLRRLTDWRILAPLPRRIGGPTHGSATTTYALDTAGQALIRLDAARTANEHVRRPGVPGERFIAHTLAVSELSVRLIEAARDHGGFEVTTFDAEPDCWVPNGLGGWLKPDAYTVLSTSDYDDAWWIEVDRATEHLTTLRRKLTTYLDFAHRGQLGPDDVLPRVLVTVPDDRRRHDVADLCEALPDPSAVLLHVATFSDASQLLTGALTQSG